MVPGDCNQGHNSQVFQQSDLSLRASLASHRAGRPNPAAVIRPGGEIQEKQLSIFAQNFIVNTVYAEPM